MDSEFVLVLSVQSAHGPRLIHGSKFNFNIIEPSLSGSSKWLSNV